MFRERSHLGGLIFHASSMNNPEDWA